MPRGDRTGPMGMGRAGYCSGFVAPGYANRSGCIRGFGSGYGTLRGYRRMFHAAGMPGWMSDRNAAYVESNAISLEKTYLENKVVLLETQLREIKSQLNHLNEEG